MSDGQNSRPTGLARALSKLGFCSRSQAFTLIRAGRVRLNGKHVRDPEKPVRLGTDRIEIDGAQVRRAAKIYLILNKPRGLVTTRHDEKDRKTIYSLLPEHQEWLAPVGRLDMASEGLLLFTNDTAWAARVTAPESDLDKTYHVQVGSLADNKLIRSMEHGVQVETDFLAAKRADIFIGRCFL